MAIKLQTSKYGQSGSPSNQFDVHDPKPMYMLGNFTFRAYRYLHIELNEAYDSGVMNYMEQRHTTMVSQQSKKAVGGKGVDNHGGRCSKSQKHILHEIDQDRSP